jgi:hypothetical protein
MLCELFGQRMSLKRTVALRTECLGERLVSVSIRMETGAIVAMLTHPSRPRESGLEIDVRFDENSFPNTSTGKGIDA